MPKSALCTVVVGVALGGALAGCGDDDGNGEQTSEGRDAEQRDARPDRPAADSPDDPLQQATAYAREQYPEATDTDDFLAAATSGCYVGLTGEYLGGPAGWSVEKTLRVEYPEAELQAIFHSAREDCSQ